MSKIQEIRILPPIAISRLGASQNPLEAYELTISEEKPLDFRKIDLRDNLVVNTDGTVTLQEINGDAKAELSFKDQNQNIKPVAPFLELFYMPEGESRLYPLTVKALKEAGYTAINTENIADYIQWKVSIANHKIYRRTYDVNDQIACEQTIKSHTAHALEGTSPNFIEGKKLPFGKAQFIKPSTEDEVIRLRFTPAHGKVYRSNGFITKDEITQFSLNESTEIKEKDKKEAKKLLAQYEDLAEKIKKQSSKEGIKKLVSEQKQLAQKIDAIYNPVLDSLGIISLYDANKGGWYGYTDDTSKVPTTNPGNIFYGYDKGGSWASLGYFDDACDGFISASLQSLDAKTSITTKASIVAGPPDFAPDTMPVRVATDEIEQIVLGVNVSEPTIEEVEEIVRRSFETVRLMNTSVMNGDTVEGGKPNQASNMSRQDTNDTRTLFRPLAATSIVDNLALLSLHERVYNGLGAGKSAWFAELLRTPEEIGDLSDEGRRKMPALMRGADARALTLTRRQIDTVKKAGWQFLEKQDALEAVCATIEKEDIISQMMYQAQGNPYSVLPRSAVSNCFPGLEYDFRNLWRRAFKEIVLVESSNIVLEDNSTDANTTDLQFSYLIWIDESATMVKARGPVLPSRISDLNTGNGNALFMEWSNNLAQYIVAAQKSNAPYEVTAYFTTAKWKNEAETDDQIGPEAIPYLLDDIQVPDKSDASYQEKIDYLIAKGQIVKKNLTVRKFFKTDSLVMEDGLVNPGDMTQGLCSPWQNDYIECACYYWAASRPDYVNVEANDKGVSQGDNWIAKQRTGKYTPSTKIGENPALLTYTDLFKDWQKELSFVIKGKTEDTDAIASKNKKDE